MIGLNNGWQFIENWDDEFLRKDVKGQIDVRLPHTVKELPLHYADDRDYQKISGYKKKVSLPDEVEGKRVFLQFDGAAHIAEVFIDGNRVCEHKGGYTAFRVEISESVKGKKEFCVAVKLDSTENGSIPPFGYVIDYLTYGGLYRPVWLDLQPEEYISDLFVSTPKKDTVHLKMEIEGKKKQKKKIVISDADGKIIKELESDLEELEFKVEDVKVWDSDHPVLYQCSVELSNGACRCVRFGFRTIAFKADGFYLNGKRMVMRGLDRHQCYPYLGYAVSDSLQKEDARILKEELSCNAVRTSHYPQSQAFLDACDELGLLVFTEIPGWQHIGDEGWKDVACKQVEEMVLQYRNHPSIVLWGVRINESQDDDEFYRRTNEIAHRLDPSRPTSGVRYLLKSSLLEDVYAYNDFSHTGNNPGVRKKKDVTTDMNKALLVSEANGHMFPTKSFDPWIKRQEHALRHARVMNDALASGEHAGVFQWCMFDYATHKDFGSGDRICYHGVMDAFRNPKMASYVYAIQGDHEDILEVSCLMDIGDYPGSRVPDFYVFTNADSVKLYKNDYFVKEYSYSRFKGLKHGPLKINDLIGDILMEAEGYDARKAKEVHDCLQIAKKYGDQLPLPYKLKVGRTMMQFGISEREVNRLYSKYVGNWGGEATVWRFDAIRDGKVVATRRLCPSAKLHLEVKNSSSVLKEGDSYDMAAIRIRILDENGNVASYDQAPLIYECSGEIEIAGPKVSVAEGGMGGTYVRSTGKKGKGTLLISSPGLESVKVEFVIE